MQRNIVILVIAVVIVAACGVIAYPLVNTPARASIKSVGTDKELYHSHEIMHIMVSFDSAGDAGNITLRLQGIQDRDGYFQLNQDIPVTLSPGSGSYAYDHQLPHCSSCSGLLEGTYYVNATLIRDGTPLSTMGNSFQLRQ